MPSSSLPRPCGRISGAPIWRRRSPIIAAASAATVLLLARAEPSPFALRILSALVMAPVAIAAAWFGSPWLGMLTALAAAVMAWEWARLCRGGPLGVSGIVLILAAVAAAVAAALAGAGIGIAVAVIGAAPPSRAGGRRGSSTLRRYLWCWSAQDLRLLSSSAILRSRWPSEGSA